MSNDTSPILIAEPVTIAPFAKAPFFIKDFIHFIKFELILSVLLKSSLVSIDEKVLSVLEYFLNLQLQFTLIVSGL